MDFSKFVKLYSTICGVVFAVVVIALGVSLINPVSVFPISSECIFTDYVSLWILSITTVCVVILCYLGTLYITPLLPYPLLSCPSVQTPRPPIPRSVLVVSFIDSVLILVALIMSMICLGKAFEIKIGRVVCLPLVGKIMIFVVPNLIFLLVGHVLWYTYKGLFQYSTNSSTNSSTASFHLPRQSFDDAHVHEINKGESATKLT